VLSGEYIHCHHQWFSFNIAPNATCKFLQEVPNEFQQSSSSSSSSSCCVVLCCVVLLFHTICLVDINRACMLLTQFGWQKLTCPHGTGVDKSTRYTNIVALYLIATLRMQKSTGSNSRIAAVIVVVSYWLLHTVCWIYSWLTEVDPPMIYLVFSSNFTNIKVVVSYCLVCRETSACACTKSGSTWSVTVI
jgi:hypothetical protein